MNLTRHILEKSRTKVMGILNLTPDSFYDGGKYSIDNVNQHIKDMIQCGADIIDVGAESSRPGANPISFDEEISRLDPVFELLSSYNILFSIDTNKPEVARIAIQKGFDIINDITGGGESGGMFKVAAEFNVPIIIMHMLGNPLTMQNKPIYDDVIDDIKKYFCHQIKLAQLFGVKDKNIILDPGIGFGKDMSDNIEIVNRLQEIKSLGYSVLIGTSRKSFLQLDDDKPIDRLPASISSMTLAITNGADIVRVHDVKESCKSTRITDRFTSKIEVN
ncbi:MAG: dihydropteroate synthase [Candidatus Marinimicrobia bacterium]|nr:dihydropteroate synthase [Candidatus Neomarinimicrobiota bacterium]MBL7022738.1 dihydropteroate synthase [Candidatus Neomarinimicrobiota bacterium]MBL7109623.1 dihydropteroate synthase [Candidatus Neomarinimicrobiota bacterium]